ncbi:MAG: multidrug ABC transporter ATPase/permease [Bacteroidetes bacterium]|nr:MAG: multidrug ABC transporter ATPase/permease [Bacteroidota bacterium]
MKELKKISTLNKLYLLFSRHEKIKTLGLLFLMLIGALMELIGIGAIPAFILIVASPEKVLLHPLSGTVAHWFRVDNSRELLVVGSVGLISFFVTKGLLLAVINYIKIRFVQYKYTELSRSLFSKYIHAPYTFHLYRNSSELLRNIISETHVLVYNVFVALLNISLNIVTMILIVAFLIVVQPLFSLLALTTLGVLSWSMMKLVERKTQYFGQEEIQQRQISNKAVLEALSGIKDIQVLGREEHFISQFNYSIVRRARSRFFIEMVQSFNRPVFETITVIGVLGLALVLSANEQSIERTIAVLALFAAATYRLMPIFQGLVSEINSLRYHIYSVDPVFDDLQHLQNSFSESGNNQNQPLTFKREIRIENISFAYPNTDKDVLSNINLIIPHGFVVALVGESGAGKTSLVDALLGLLRIDKGRISVDGVNIYSSLKAWQNTIGYIPQNIYLADDTLKHNVAFGISDNEINDAQFWEAVEASLLKDLIEQLPEKENTMIGELGIRLSGGQRQRIGIARALYHNPRLLIIDEGTSALDNLTEKYVIEAIEKLRNDRTIIMIAHRLTTVKNCDVICLMEDGKITDKGSYDELLNRNTKFKEMAEVITN